MNAIKPDELTRLCLRLIEVRSLANAAIQARGPIEGYAYAFGMLEVVLDGLAAELTKRKVVGPCWSCDAPNSPAYVCDHGHEWFCCEETCGQKVGVGALPHNKGLPIVDWDDCHECQDLARLDEEEFRARTEDRRDF